ncbi:hypothetical protein CROQUDRAFT_49550 [Cronartium quercuum f. sp. fusiforme G11]|uniref:Uncharacterized protein n=1 Tax=Cronartium quercuum f. sp. fusiforme G11 TaxID=708437 RepID=A0A9P6NFX2_9BASI|nr:hypothetical protein CROQUDRAFT_49550 [Cronartium quercuum f. sp. fusiforme G11]
MKNVSICFISLITISLILSPLLRRSSNYNSIRSSHKSYIKKRMNYRKICKPKKNPNYEKNQNEESFKSKGTNWQGDWSSGNCAYKMWSRPSNLGYIAISSNQWKESKACGTCISVTGPGGTFIGIVGDQCPSCVQDGLDLDDSFWNQVSGNQKPGIIDINWTIIPCSFSEPLKFINNIGTSQYWVSIQVVGSNTAIQSLEISHPGKESWQTLKLGTNSNYWQLEGDGGEMGETADLKVTCQDGKTFITQSVDIATPQNIHTATVNCN